jgi:hypothetical protein
VVNAENLAITCKQRLFVSGRDGVHELSGSAGGGCGTQLIPVRVPGVPDKCMLNGIAAQGNYLYLACVHIDETSLPLIPGVLGDVNQIEQTGMGLLRAYLESMACPVDSYIVRCDLSQTPLAFTDLLASLPGHVMANGITTDANGTNLYVANSAPGIAAGIYRIPLNAAGDQSGATLWCRPPGCKPNGLKVRDDALYFTGNGSVAAVLGRVPIEQDGSAGAPQVIDTSGLSVDDFDLADEGFVVAQFSEHMIFGSGFLRFLSQDGREVAVLKRDEIANPCAVAVARESSTLFRAGDVVIADKARRSVTLFEPEGRWRKWLLATA